MPLLSAFSLVILFSSNFSFYLQLWGKKLGKIITKHLRQPRHEDEQVANFGQEVWWNELIQSTRFNDMFWRIVEKIGFQKLGRCISFGLKSLGREHFEPVNSSPRPICLLNFKDQIQRQGQYKYKDKPRRMFWYMLIYTGSSAQYPKNVTLSFELQNL